MRYGANDYIYRPFDIHEMENLVARHIAATNGRRKKAAATEELRHLNEDLVRRLQDSQRMAILGMTSAQLVHDISNPLTIVIGYLDLLDMQVAGDAGGTAKSEAKEHIEAIRKNLQHCVEVLRAWRSLGNKSALRLEPIPIAKFLDDATSLLCSAARPTQVQTTIEPSLSHATVIGDRPHLRRARHNIIQNAIQACPPEGGVVRIEAAREGDDLVIRVADNGCGIAPDDLDKVFDPFFTKGETGGTGLVLFVVRQVAEDHGGSVCITSQPGRGTTVTFRIPFRR